MNLFRVTNENDLEDIITKNNDKLILLMVGSKTCVQSNTVKPKFIELAKNNTSGLFIFIDLTKFTETHKKYLSDLKGTPKFIFFFNNNNLGCIYGPDHTILFTHYNGIVQKLDIFRQQLLRSSTQNSVQHKPQTNQNNQAVTQLQPQTQPQTQPQQKQLQAQSQQQSQLQTQNSIPPTNENKQVILAKLNEMKNAGIMLTNDYTIESDFDKMYTEYQFQIALIEKRLNQREIATESVAEPVQATVQGTEPVINNRNGKSEVIKSRDEKIKEIIELDRLNKYIQMQQFTKLQTLQKIQKIKELEERKENERNDRRRKED